MDRQIDERRAPKRLRKSERKEPPGWVGTLQSALPQAGLTRPEADALTPRDFRLLTRLLGPVLSTRAFPTIVVCGRGDNPIRCSCPSGDRSDSSPPTVLVRGPERSP
jgi:hypothetical protein